MPLQVPQGYPDYMRRSTVTDQLLVNSTVAGAGPQQYGTFYAANLPALLVNMTNGVSPVRIEFRWCSDPLGTIVLRAPFIDVPVGKSLAHTVVPEAPYLNIVTLQDGLGDALNYSLQVSVVPDIRYPTTDPKWTNIINGLQNPIGAGATVTQVSPVVRVGSIEWFAFVSGGSWQATLVSVDVNGNLTALGRMNSNTPQYATQRAYWAGGGLEAMIFNGAAGAQTFDLVVTANPTLGV